MCTGQGDFEHDYIIGVFKIRHPEVYGIDDVGGLLLGRTGKIGQGIAFVLCEFLLWQNVISLR